MIAFDVQDITCGHCVNTVSQAVRRADAQAAVSVDLATRRVQIDSPSGDAATFQRAIEEAGYHPVPVSGSAAPRPARTGGCCGSCH
jgi:copper chaperone